EEGDPLDINVAGGAGGDGGDGGDGLPGGAGGDGGDGGGAVALVARGGLTLDNVTIKANGGDGAPGAASSPFAGDSFPGVGQEGQPGESGASVSAADAQPGARGGDGGFGGTGGAGGAGGGGAGGTVTVRASALIFEGDTTIDVLGGTSPGTPGDDGVYGTTSHAMAGTPLSIDAGEIVSSVNENVAANSFIVEEPNVPLLPGLKGPAAPAGILEDWLAEDLSDLLAGATDDDGVALLRLDTTREAMLLGADYVDYDLLVLANVGDRDLFDVKIGVDPSEADASFLTDIGDGNALLADQLFATLVPSIGTRFNVEFTDLGEVFSGSTTELAAGGDPFFVRGAGATTGTIPLPAAGWMLLGGLAALGALRRPRKG
ncbi:MAG: VPLPA-CTERM sorting domain-containing protein, partial [Pseudomonadota bacterium]